MGRHAYQIFVSSAVSSTGCVARQSIMCRRVTIQSIEAESFGKSENYLRQKKAVDTHRIRFSVRRRKESAGSSCSWEVFGRSGRAQSLRQRVSTAATCAAAGQAQPRLARSTLEQAVTFEAVGQRGLLEMARVEEHREGRFDALSLIGEF